jgi:hypothetical protein
MNRARRPLRLRRCGFPPLRRPVTALFNQERIVARGWPVAENRISIAELTYSLVFAGVPAAEVPSSHLDFRHHSVERWRRRHI